MPHSVFTGRIVGPGEPQFLADDTDGAIALAEEERDTCPKCGLPRAVCGDPANQFAFEPTERICWPTWFQNQYERSPQWEAKQPDSRAATQVSSRFKDGFDPDLMVGLDLPTDS